jgi:dipeptidyl aminopeptidase/acylaminoacyl peptidase
MRAGRLSVDDLLNLHVVSDAQIAPGGSHVLYCVAENGADKGQRAPVSRIWMQKLGSSEADQLTFGPYTDRQPRWSPEGSRVSFLSDRESRGTSQLYVLDAGPSEARKLSSLPAGVSSHAWAPGGDRIALVSRDHIPEQDNDVKLFDSDRRFDRLYLCDIESGAISPMGHGDLHVWEYCWSPDGRSIAAIASDEPFEWGWYDARLVRIDVDTGEVRALYESERQIARPVWSPDGSKIALTTCRWSDPGMTGGDVLVIDAESGACQCPTSGEPRSHYTVHWLADGSGLISVGLESARAQICRVDLRSGSTPSQTLDAGLVDYGGTFDPESGRVALTLSTIQSSPEVWVSEASSDGLLGELVRFTTTNETVEFAEMTTEWLTWNSRDGLFVEGLLVRPAEAATEPTPMVTLVHGGPTAAAMSSFPMASAAAWTPFLIEAGVSVFMPNYRGSNGFGVEFAEANLGDLGGLDLEDILTGIDVCIARGFANPEKLGIGGWSYGGYLTAWAITQTDRFAAAVAGASITNWYSFHGGTNIPGFDGQFIGAAPDELDGPYAWRSPLFACKNVRTPTLFVHGEQDPCCPVGQAFEMVRALRRRGVQTECAVYPREPHGFVEREHRRDMVDRSVGWFLSHLGVSCPQ